MEINVMTSAVILHPKPESGYHYHINKDPERIRGSGSQWFSNATGVQLNLGHLGQQQLPRP